MRELRLNFAQRRPVENLDLGAPLTAQPPREALLDIDGGGIAMDIKIPRRADEIRDAGLARECLVHLHRGIIEILHGVG